MQKGKSRNVLASPLGEEGHEVAKGWTVVRMIMTLDVDVTAERRHYNTHRPLKGKRLTTFCASLALLHPLLSLTHWIFRSLMLPYKSSSLVQNVFAVHRFARGAADWRSGPRWSILSVLCPVHPFPLRGTSPQGETRDMREKTESHIFHVPFRSFPLWWRAQRASQQNGYFAI